MKELEANESKTQMVNLKFAKNWQSVVETGIGANWNQPVRQLFSPIRLSTIQRHLQTLDQHTEALDDRLENIFTIDLLLHQAHGAIASLTEELRDYLVPKPQYGVGRMLLQRMPRTLTQRQDMANAIVPPSLISYQAIAQTDRHSITRSCEHTNLITRAQAPYYKNKDLNLTHKNTWWYMLSCSGHVISVLAWRYSYKMALLTDPSKSNFVCHAVWFFH